MAGDDKNDDGFDPWADLESAQTPDVEGEFDFAFEGKPAGDDEPVAATPPDAVSPGDDEPAAEPVLNAERASDADDGLVGDESVSDWLAEAADGGDEPTTLGLFAGDDDPAADGIDPAAVRVGMSESGIIDEEETPADSFASAELSDFADSSASADPILPASDETQGDDDFGWSEIDVESVTESSGEAMPFGVVGSDLDDRPEEGGDFAGVSAADASHDADGDAGPEAAEAAIVAAGAVAAMKPAKRRAAKKKGGLGQLIGVVMGGVLALPITFAILIWGFRKDPLHLVRNVPDSVAFLFPEELVRGGRPKSDGVAGGPTLDDLPVLVTDGTASEPAVAVGEGDAEPATEPMPEPTSEDSAVATAEPRDAAEPPMTAETADRGVEPGEEPTSAPLVPDAADLAALTPAEPAVPMVEPVEAGLPAAEPVIPPAPPSPPAPPEPEPLDLAAIDHAVAAAAEAFEAVKAAENDGDPDPTRRERSRNRLLVDWYRQLSAVAEELAALERVAADTGRPLPSPPDAVAGLQSALVADPARLSDLARLSRNWMSYPGRSTSGIVMPAVLGGVRQVGPYWCSTVTIAEAGDRTRDLAVISRSEPVAVPGEAVLVTGLIVDGDTVWASDVRPARADGASSPRNESPATDPLAAPTPDTVPGDAPVTDPGGDATGLDPFATPEP